LKLNIVFLELEEATNTCYFVIGLQLQLIFCMRHLYANFRKRFSGKKLKILMWKAASSTHPVVWERVMLTIKEILMFTYTLLYTSAIQWWNDKY